MAVVQLQSHTSHTKQLSKEGAAVDAGTAYPDSRSIPDPAGEIDDCLAAFNESGEFSMIRTFTGLLVTAALASTVSAADEELIFQVMRIKLDIEGSSLELAIHVTGMQACKLDGLLDADDLNVVGNAYRRADLEAFLTGSMKSSLIVRGLALQPGTPQCVGVKETIAKAAPEFSKLADSMRALGLR